MGDSDELVIESRKFNPESLDVEVVSVKWCPPCAYFDPEIVEYHMVHAKDEKCIRAEYRVDCTHRKVCGSRKKGAV